MKDKKLIERRFAAHFATYNQHAKVQGDICERLSEMVCDSVDILDTDDLRILEVGAGTGLLTSSLLPRFGGSKWFVNELSSDAKPYLDGVFGVSGATPTYLFGDAESMALPQQLDMVVSSSAVQWFDDVDSFIASLSLKPGGVVAISTFGVDNFREIAYATQSDGLTYLEESHFVKLFDSLGYEVVSAVSYSKELLFDNPVEVLRHLRYTGVNSIRSVSWSKGLMARFVERYVERYSCGPSVKLTYNPLLIVAKKI